MLLYKKRYEVNRELLQRAKYFVLLSQNASSKLYTLCKALVATHYAVFGL